MSVHKKPYFLSEEEREFFKRTSKYEMYFMLLYYAIRVQGEQETDADKSLVLKEIAECKQILKQNNII